MLEVGHPAPAFDLPDANVEMVGLSSFRGKRHVVRASIRGRHAGLHDGASEFSDLQDEFESTERACWA